MGKELYFEDFKIGQCFTSNSYQISKQEIIEFATKYDPQIFHTNEELAKNSFFGTLVASGWHTAAITMKLIIESDMKVKNGMIGAGVEVSWPKPTYPDDILTVYSTILELNEPKSKPDCGFILVESLTKNQNNEIIMREKSRIMVQKRKKN